jgi:hypothetical protein
VQIIATKLWGQVMPMSFFPAYCAITLAFAAACQKFFVVRPLPVAAGLVYRPTGLFYRPTVGLPAKTVFVW